jgi:putative ATPase
VLFASEGLPERAPLAARVRPHRIEDFAGQNHLIGPGKPLSRLLASKQWQTSLIFHGPPGCGKTTLALLIAETLDLPVAKLSAVDSGVKELRSVAERARESDRPTIVFIDEIHRYSKTQQDALLPHVESGLLRLIGATTENPRSCLTPAMLSRCRVYTLKRLSAEDVREVLQRALSSDEGMGKLQAQVDPGAADALVALARGDARRALNLLEQACVTSPIDSEGRPLVTLESVQALQTDHAPSYSELDQVAHMSALIKSIRGSDPQAALYWLARLVVGGETVEYITRRLRIAASEDVGLADPNAVIHTQSCCSAAEAVGYPEARYLLTQATLYLSLAPKSDSMKAYFAAEQSVRQQPHLPVPHWLAPGGKYINPHEEPLHFRRVSHFPDGYTGQRFYEPGSLAHESRLAQRLKDLWGE